MGEEFYLSGDDVRYQRSVNKRVMGGRTSQRPGARRRRGAQGGGGGNAGLFRTLAAIPVASFAGSILTPGTGGAHRFKRGSNGQEVLDTSKTFTLCNSDELNAVATSKNVQAKKINGRWYVDVEPCA